MLIGPSTEVPRNSGHPRVLKGRNLGSHPALRVLGEHPRVALAGDERVEHEARRLAGDVRDHAVQLDAGVLEQVLQPLNFAGPLLRQRGAVPRQVTQPPDRRRRDEARPDQPVRDQVGDPLRVADVALTTGHLLQVPGVEQPGLHDVLEQVVDGLPEHPGRLHADQRDPRRQQPVAHPQQLWRRGAERPEAPAREVRLQDARPNVELQRRIRLLDPDEVAKLVKRYEAGSTMAELARDLGVHRGTVRAHLERQGARLRRGSSFPPEHLPRAVRL